MSEFFVRRPIVAIVIAILMTLVGGVCILGLPIAQYPQIAPPEIQVQTHYTGAHALMIEQSVAAPIELQQHFSRELRLDQFVRPTVAPAGNWKRPDWRGRTTRDALVVDSPPTDEG